MFLIPVVTFYICVQISNELGQNAVVADVPSYLF